MRPPTVQVDTYYAQNVSISAPAPLLNLHYPSTVVRHGSCLLTDLVPDLLYIMLNLKTCTTFHKSRFNRHPPMLLLTSDNHMHQITPFTESHPLYKLNEIFALVLSHWVPSRVVDFSKHTRLNYPIMVRF